MGGGWDQADMAPPLAAGLVVGADDQQSGVLALRAGVGLKRDSGETGDLGEPGLQLLEEPAVTARLLRGRERMQRVELRP